ncbi:hypothetical protein [Tenacibaculum ovolyticum]|uniref:hypothetical protein n=1 Tax=Tenacibaculum ovolyticum TaxID=104270 RepID=UPI001F354E96|nr:hypothetical protein [Tenacibaculum ovolyticum]
MKLLKYLGVSTLIFLFLSCNKNLKIVDYVDFKKSFELVNIKGLEKGFTGKKNKIFKGSEIHNRLIEWIKRNEENWYSTDVSYQGSVYVIQNDFKLIYLNTSKEVVISYENLNGEMKQYVKEIEKGDLNFLYMERENMKVE